MPVTFEKATKATLADLARVMKAHHPVLSACGVTVDVLMTQDVDEETGEVSATLKHNRYPAVAIIKATTLKERVLGVADALLIIDSVTFDGLTDKEKAAVLDHELAHLLVRGEHGEDLAMVDGALSDKPKLDDQARPKLKMRLHDWQLGGFRDVAQRHGKNAIEVQAVRACVDTAGQYFWDWDKPRKVA